MISLKVHPTSQNLPCCCKVLTGDLSCQLLLPKFLFVMKACMAVLERGSRSAAFSGLLSLGKLPGSSNRSCICDFDVGSPSPQTALGGVGLSYGWEVAPGAVPQTPFRPCPLPLAAPHLHPVTACRGEGLGSQVEPHSPWRLRVLADLM